MSLLLALSLLSPTADAASVLTFRSDAPVHLYVDGKKAASTTLGRAAELRLDPGSHSLRLESITGRVLHSDKLKLDDNTAVETRWHRRNFEVMGAVELPSYHEAVEETAVAEAVPAEEVPVEEAPVEEAPIEEASGDEAVIIGAAVADEELAEELTDEAPTDDEAAAGAVVAATPAAVTPTAVTPAAAPLPDDGDALADAAAPEEDLPGEMITGDSLYSDDSIVLISGPIEEVAEDAPLALSAAAGAAAVPAAARQATAVPVPTAPIADPIAAQARQPGLVTAAAPLPDATEEDALADAESSAPLTAVAAAPSDSEPLPELGVDLSNPSVAWSDDVLHLTFSQDGGGEALMSVVVSPERLVVTDAQGAARYAVALTPAEVAAPVDPNAPGTVQFFTRDGQWANVYINGEVAAYIANDAQAKLDLEPGAYEVELRDARGKEIWHKGTLTVAPGKALEIGFAQTLTPEAQGAKDAWQPFEESAQR